MKNSNIQVLRGVLCLMVFCSHYIGAYSKGLFLYGINLSETPLRGLWGGDIAVIVFFFLSGYFAYKKKSISVNSYIFEVINRHCRLYFLYLTVLLIGILARFTAIPFSSNLLSVWISKFWSDDLTLKQLILHLFLISPFDSHLIIPPIWTLRIEMRMIFLIPVFQYLLDYSSKKNSAFVILLYIVSIIASYYIGFMFYFPAFIIGMGYRKFSEEMKCRIDKRTIRLLSYAVSILCLDIQYIIKDLQKSELSFITLLINTIGCILLVNNVIRINGLNPVFKPLKVLGDISFPFYLVHFVTLLWFRFLVERIGFVAYGFISLTISILLAYILFRFDGRIQPHIKGYINDMVHINNDIVSKDQTSRSQV